MDDLMLVAESMEEPMEKFQRWKDAMESKGLRVNIRKTKAMISDPDFGQLDESGDWPCSVCSKCVKISSIFCNYCNFWLHKRCSDVKGSLGSEVNFQV